MRKAQSYPEKPIRGKYHEIWVSCRHTRHYFARLIAKNGAVHVVDYCPSCGGQSQFYGRLELVARGIDTETLPLLKDNRELTGDLFD